MKDTLFSFKLYLQGLKKVRAVGIAASICVIVLNIIVPVLNMIENSRTWPGMVHKIEEVETYYFSPFGLLMILFAPLMVYTMFSYLNERSKSDFYHSLPQTRGCVYVSFTCSIITWLVGILAASAVINTFFWLMVPYSHLSLSTVLLTFLNYVLLTLLMMGFMLLAMNLTGTTVSNFLIFILVTLFVRFVGTMFIQSVDEMTNIFILEESWMKVLGYQFFLPWTLLETLGGGRNAGEAFTQTGLMAYTFVISLALIAASGILYKKRRSEIAGQSAPNAKLQTVYRSAVTFPFVLIMALCFFVDGLDFESYQIILLAIVFLVHVLFELITTKKVKSMVRSLPKIIIPFICGIIFVSGVFITKNSIEGFQPQPDEIKTITILSSGNGTYEDIQTQSITISNKRANEIISENLRKNIQDGTHWYADGQPKEWIKVRIETTDGQKAAREFTILESQYKELISALTQSEEYKEAYTKMKFRDRQTVKLWEVEMNYKEAYTKIPDISNIDYMHTFSNHYLDGTHRDELWKCFVEEYNKLSLEQKIEVKEIGSNYYADDIPYITVAGPVGLTHFNSTYAIIFEYMPKTMALCAEYSNIYSGDTNTEASLSKFTQSIEELEIDRLVYASFRIELQKLYGDYEMSVSTPSILGSNSQKENILHIETLKEVSKALLECENTRDYGTENKKYYQLYINIECEYEDSFSRWFEHDIIVTLTDNEYETIKDLMYTHH